MSEGEPVGNFERMDVYRPFVAPVGRHSKMHYKIGRFTEGNDRLVIAFVKLLKFPEFLDDNFTIFNVAESRSVVVVLEGNFQFPS